MISLRSIADRYGLEDNEACQVWEMSDTIKQIGLSNYLVNKPMEIYFVAILKSEGYSLERG